VAVGIGCRLSVSGYLTVATGAALSCVWLSAHGSWSWLLTGLSLEAVRVCDGGIFGLVLLSEGTACL
jgi:hypothetical protein